MTERDFDTPVETPTVQPVPAQGAKPAQTVPVVAVVLAVNRISVSLSGGHS